jgi:hypothetical protein
VIIRYATSDFSDYIVTGGTITTDGSYTVHTFTSSGTFTVGPVAILKDIIQEGIIPFPR